MLLLLVLVIALVVAYKAMPYGLIPALSRTVMGMVSVATAAGFTGPLQRALGVQNEYLPGSCFLAITLVTYGFMRTVTMYLMLEREITLPDLADRIGGGIAGFLGGLLLGGFVCTALLAFPLPAFAKPVTKSLPRPAEFAVGAARFIGFFAGESGKDIELWTILPHLDKSRNRPPPRTPPSEEPDDSGPEPTEDNDETGGEARLTPIHTPRIAAKPRLPGHPACAHNT